MLHAPSLASRSAATPCAPACPARLSLRLAPLTICRAAEPNNASGSSKDDSDGEASGSGSPLKLPKRGYFSIADTKAEVYSKAGEKFDPTKRGGRYKSEFIWNTNWQDALAREEQLRAKQEAAKARKEQQSGFLSLSRLSELDRVDVDLSDVLKRKRQEDEDAKAAVAAARASLPLGKPSAGGSAGRAAAGPAGTSGRPSATVVPVFTRKEAARLSRTNKSLSRTAVMVEVPALDAEKARKAEEERKRYEQLKVEQQIWTIGFIAAGCAMAYSSYSSDVAASYTVGALGGFTYLRLLSKSVDALGADGAAGVAGGMASQQRLLIPIILALGYNRYNQLYSEQVGVTLELLPMLVGFFTYKLAVIARQYRDVFFAPKEAQQE